MKKGPDEQADIEKNAISSISLTEARFGGERVDDLSKLEINVGDVFIVYRLGPIDLARIEKGAMFPSRLIFKVTALQPPTTEGTSLRFTGEYISGADQRKQITFQEHRLFIAPNGNILLIAPTATGGVSTPFNRDTPVLVYKRPELPISTAASRPHTNPTGAMLIDGVRNALANASGKED